MKSISAPLKQAFLNGYRATLVKLTLKDGTVYGYTDHDNQLSVTGIAGVVFKPAPGLKRSNMTSTVDDQVSNQEFASAWVDAPESDLLAGRFDNAQIEIMFCAWNNTALGYTTVDRGQLGVIQWTGDGFRCDVQSHMRQLTRNINFIFTASCRHQLFSQFDNTHIGACTLNNMSYVYSGSVISTVYVGLEKVKFTFSGSIGAVGYCTNGVVRFTSGPNANLSFPVKEHGSGFIELMVPTPYNITAGNNFNIWAGCDKTFATCKAKFGNQINFGGFPHIQTEVTTR